MKDTYSEYLIFQRNEFVTKILNLADEYWHTCPERDVMPSMNEFALFHDEDLNLLSKEDFDKITAEEERTDG